MTKSRNTHLSKLVNIDIITYKYAAYNKNLEIVGFDVIGPLAKLFSLGIYYSGLYTTFAFTSLSIGKKDLFFLRSGKGEYKSS